MTSKATRPPASVRRTPPASAGKRSFDKNGELRDFVASARQSLADPDWWRKMELGRGAEVRRCVFTNYCEALDQRHAEVTCQLWDRDLDARDSTSPDGRPALSGDGKRRLVPPAWD